MFDKANRKVDIKMRDRKKSGYEKEPKAVKDRKHSVWYFCSKCGAGYLVYRGKVSCNCVRKEKYEGTY